jgi:hypothetical protein
VLVITDIIANPTEVSLRPVIASKSSMDFIVK